MLDGCDRGSERWVVSRGTIKLFNRKFEAWVKRRGFGRMNISTVFEVDAPMNLDPSERNYDGSVGPCHPSRKLARGPR